MSIKVRDELLNRLLLFLKRQEAYRDLAAYMLENHVKLKQESVSYYEVRVHK